MEPLTNTPEGVVFAQGVSQRLADLYKSVFSEGLDTSFDIVKDNGTREVGYYRSRYDRSKTDFTFILNSNGDVVGIENGALHLELNVAMEEFGADSEEKVHYPLVVTTLPTTNRSSIQVLIREDGFSEVVIELYGKSQSHFFRVRSKYVSGDQVVLPLMQVEIASNDGVYIVVGNEADKLIRSHLANGVIKFDVRKLVDYILSPTADQNFDHPETLFKLTQTTLPGNRIVYDPNQAAVKIDGERYGLFRLQRESLAGEPTGWRYALISPNGQVEIVDTDLRPIAEVVEDLQTKNAQDSR